MYDISLVVEESFELERKTIDDKDDALMFLFNIQKNNINLFEKIKKACQSDNCHESKEIIELLPSLVENNYTD